MRQAGPPDARILVDLMTEFYAESDYVLDPRPASKAFAPLLTDSRLGRVWLIELGSSDVGYVVVTFVYGMEYGGLMAVVDDFFVRRAFRGLGLGNATLLAVRDFCASLGVRAMRVEVSADNAAAQAAYRHSGFVKTDRQLMMLPLAAPTHEGS
jgi:GNAT superfamily N-acetyltransferase